MPAPGSGGRWTGAKTSEKSWPALDVDFALSKAHGRPAVGWREIQMTEQTIFLSALDFPDAAKRSAYLDSACAGDAGLRQQVDALLAAHERSGQFLDDPAVAQMAAARPRTGEETVTVDANAAAGRDEDLGFLQTPTRPDSLGRLAHYEVLEVLGRGGFGTVLRAFDDHLHRMVAIKVLAPQLATSGTARSRFRREANSGA